MDLDNMNISDELREKAKECTTPEELLALAKREGYKLSEAEMEAVSGGGWGGGGGKHLVCPNCGANLGSDLNAQPSQCPECGVSFTYVDAD